MVAIGALRVNISFKQHIYWVSNLVNNILIHIVRLYINMKGWQELQHNKIKTEKFLIYSVQLKFE